MRQELRQFIPFCIVGGVGFLVDAGILGLLVHGLGADHLSQLLAQHFDVHELVQQAHQAG